MTPSSSGQEDEIRVVTIVVPVYRDAHRAVSLLGRLSGLRLDGGRRLQIVVVDDGSADGTAETILAGHRSDFELVQLPSNQGRAIARNAGAARALGEVILFMDCDCVPDRPDVVERHLMHWNHQTVASAGPVHGIGGDFWDRYQRDASDRRSLQHASGIQYSGSSQNMMIRRRIFEHVGGFDPRYREYGFEDRDLLLRVRKLGNIAWSNEALVRHTDVLSLESVCRKMREAGGGSSALFSRENPEAYSALGYHAIDGRLHPWLRLPGKAAGKTLGILVQLGERILSMDILPYSVKRTYVRLASALSYLAGTADDRIDAA